MYYFGRSLHCNETVVSVRQFRLHIIITLLTPFSVIKNLIIILNNSKQIIVQYQLSQQYKRKVTP